MGCNVKKGFIRVLPNLLTILRMILSPVLLLLLSHPAAYLSVYAICGLTDLLDGLIARKTGTQSKVGARLDSIADLLMFLAMTASMIFWAGDLLMKLLLPILIVFFIRVINSLIALIRYRALVFLHTWGNKAAGLFIFFTPVLYLLTHSFAVLIVALALALISALEETAIHLTAKEYDLDRRSMFFK